MKEPSTDIPTGTVTFLFTDIEASTRLWERDAQAMQAALSRHDEALRDAIEANGGYVFKTVGDAFCAAFDAAPDALEAALASQRALLAEEWDEGCRIRVRMALHTGAVNERVGDYFGPPVNRVARLLSAGHGGQTLLSLATQALVSDRLPAGAELRDLGERHLKDLFRPERIFELSAPDLPSGFPPLKTLDARRNNLPLQPTPLVGREREIGEIAGLLRREEVRLLTFMGPGGTGKTRLALQVAADLVDEFENGVFFVALAPVADPELVVSTVAGTLGVIENPEQPLAEVLKNYLRAREILLLMDNFEQVVEAAPLVGELLSSCTKLKVLVTSRVPLGVYGEHEYAVPPLSLPDPACLPPAEHLSQYEAIRLFIERARAAKAGFEVTSENASAVAEICLRLDGLPLAIELAAARVKILPPQAMLERLGNRLKLLRGGARDLPKRQRTLRGALDWSHDLLDEEERTLFRRLSVFAGGRTLEAIEEICAPEGEIDALDGVQSMVEKSLLRQEETDGQPRFVMLETIHEYAREKLQESGEADVVKRAHAEYFLALAEEAEPELVGPDQVAWMDRLEAEHDNLRAALSWSLGSGEIETALRIGGNLWWFWNIRGHASEGRGWLAEGLSGSDTAGTAVRARALLALGELTMMQGEHRRARELLEESLALYREVEDSIDEAYAVCFLGWIAMLHSDFDQAAGLLEEGLALSREKGTKRDTSFILNMLAGLATYCGDYERATALYEESLGLAREAGDKQNIAAITNNLGTNAYHAGKYERAERFLEEALELSKELGEKRGISSTTEFLGYMALSQDEHKRAERFCKEAITGYQEVSDGLGVCSTLDLLAAVASARGEILRAARLWGAAEALREAIGAPCSPEYRKLTEPRMHAARSRLENALWAGAWEQGSTMTQEQAIALALAEESSG